MQFTLVYQGDLRASGRKAVDKWQIRETFDVQLRKLWRQNPLKEIDKYLDRNYKPDACYMGVQVDGIVFNPIISEKISTLAELDIMLLSKGIPSRSVTEAGDIDNRVKTLLDALRVPRLQEIPQSIARPEEMYCLLSDDKLVTRIAIGADQLLWDNPKNEALAVIRVTVKASAGNMANLGIAI